MIQGFPEEEFFASGHRACAGCGEALAVRYILKASGSNTIVVSATGCMEVVSSPYPQTAWRLPWIHSAFQNASAVASGIDKALEIQGRRKGINLLVLGGDGASFDIGLASLSGALERGHKFTYIATDNEAYMNTGIQRSGATFPFASTTTSPAGKKIPGKQEPKKPLPFIVASHGIKYVATASISHLKDLFDKVQKALAVDGPSFVHVITPCPIGWYHKSNESIEVARLAVETGVQPLYEIVGGELKFTVNPEKRIPVKEYLALQGRFKHLGEKEIPKIQQYVDERWNFLQDLSKKGKVFDVLY